MKLSMWMIANQVSELDVKLEIKDDAPAVLNSARLAYATNCVHIYQEKDYVVCNGEGNRILFYEMDTTRVFELVQSVFDSYEDWICRIKEAAAARDYQAAVDIASRMFKNPMVLFDADNKVLGLSSAYGMHDLDREWEYLCRYGYSSLNALDLIKNTYGGGFYSAEGEDYSLPKNNMITIDGLNCCIYFNDIMCGHINVIAKERPLNQGDSQLLKEVVDVLRPEMGQLPTGDTSSQVGNVFLNLMLEKPWNQEKLDMQLRYQGWMEHSPYYVTLILLSEGDADEKRVNAVAQVVRQNLKDVSVNVWKKYCILISTKNLQSDCLAQTVLKNLVGHNPVRVGYSLPNFSGIGEISKFFRQALYALKREDSKQFCDFADYAEEFLLTAEAPAGEKRMACMPAVLNLWKESRKGDEMFRTLKCFLDHERSIAQTSAALYVHRNTAVYRIKKILERMDVDLDDPKARSYCSLSLHFLDACETG